MGNFMTNRWHGKRVAVLLGGMSGERDVSLRTGAAMSAALKRSGFDVIDIDVTSGSQLASAIERDKPDVAMIALHGRFGEDGCVQGLLEMLRVPYTGCGVLASSVGMDKAVCNRVARSIGIRCPEEIVFCSDRDDIDSFVGSFALPFPVIAKPSREGSTINCTVIEDRSNLAAAIKTAICSDSKVLIESYIKGKEITVSVLDGKAFAPLEIAPKGGFYDYKSKYTKGMSEYIIPARISESATAQVKIWSEEIYTAIECEGVARADYIVDGAGEPYFLEINTVPGMTELSLVPMAAKHAGMSFDELCLRLLDGARLKVK